MNVNRLLSQAISEGDGISLLVPVADLDAARAAARDGAEGIVVSDPIEGLRDVTSLPVLCLTEGGPAAARVGADACVLRVDSVGGDWLRLRDLRAEAAELGLEPVLAVEDDEELEVALEHVDPEIILLSPPPPEDEHEPLERVLDLLPDVPAGKLAIAEVTVRTREHVVALERAGVDAVIVKQGDVAQLVGGPPPEV